jgi:hypothetical protein
MRVKRESDDEEPWRLTREELAAAYGKRVPDLIESGERELLQWGYGITSIARLLFAGKRDNAHRPYYGRCDIGGCGRL